MEHPITYENPAQYDLWNVPYDGEDVGSFSDESDLHWVAGYGWTHTHRPDGRF